MRVVLKYYLNNPLQLLFNEKPKILSSKNHLLAHWSPQWPHPELHRIGGRKSEYFALSSIFQVLAFTKPLKGCLGHKKAQLSSPESSLSFRNDSFHRDKSSTLSHSQFIHHSSLTTDGQVALFFQGTKDCQQNAAPNAFLWFLKSPSQGLKSCVKIKRGHLCHGKVMQDCLTEMYCLISQLQTPFIYQI